LGDAQGLVDDFEQRLDVDGLLKISDGTCLDNRIAIAFRVARADHNDGDGVCVDEHLKALQDDETVTGRKAEIEKDKVRLFLAGGADGAHAVACSCDIESGRLKAAGKSSELEVFIFDD